MTRYPHFAIPNLYLLNGYKELETHRGVEMQYEREDELEQCIRRLVLRKPERLVGWDLRFLRRGLALSQAEFGAQVDRDAQTIARWEKSNEPVPSTVDLAIRVRFAARFEPSLTTQEIVACVDGTARKLSDSVYLRLTAQGWQFESAPKVKYARVTVIGDAHALIGSNTGQFYRIFEYPDLSSIGSINFDLTQLGKIISFEHPSKDAIKALIDANSVLVGAELPPALVEAVAESPSLAKSQKLNVDVKGSAYEYANATIH